MRRKILLLVFSVLCWSAMLMAQTTITGTITDSDGEPLIGATILEQGTTTGTSTDIDGKYSLNVSGTGAVLIYSYTGYREATRIVAGEAVLNVSMEEASEILDEVVVSALGFKQKTDEMGATFSKIDPDDMTRSGESNFLNSLSAKASNIQIARSNGDPGAGATIRIRGANSIVGSSNPLIILDGIPINNSTVYGGGNNTTGGRTGGVSQQSRLNDLNPNDIESVQVLKGASAAALWGSKAANGVLVITTKSGKAGKVNISFKTSRGCTKNCTYTCT